MAGQQTAYAGSSVEVLVNVINEEGNHVNASINTGSTRLDAYPSVIPSVSTISLGVYKIVFSGLSPATSEGDTLVAKINGNVDGVNWTTFGILVKVVAAERGTNNAASSADIAALNDLSAADIRTAVGLANADLDTQIGTLATASDLTTVDTVVDAIKAVTDQFVFTNPGEVDANAVTGGISQADVRNAVGLASANLDTQLGDIPTVSEFTARTLASADYATSASISSLQDLSQADIRTAVGLATANLDTQLGDIPNNAELTARTLASADYATSASISSLQDLSQADIRTAVGLATANLDTQLGDIPTVSEFNARTLASTDYATSASISGLQDLSQADIRSAVGLASANLDTQLGDIPTVSEFNARTLTSTDYATSASISGLQDLSQADIRTAVGLANADLDTQLNDILNISHLDAADIRSAVGLASANLDTQLGDVPTVAEFNARSLASADYATSASVSALQDLSQADIRTAVGLANADLDTQLNDIVNISHLDAADIRSAVGLASANLDTQLADIPTVSELNARTLVSTDYATAASVSSLQDLSQADIRTAVGLANADLDTQLTDIYNKPGLSAADVRAAIGLASANLDTQLADIPTVSEFEARSIASADYATSTQVSALNDLDAAEIRASVGLAAADLDTQLSDIYNKPGLSAADMRAALGLASANLDTQLTDIYNKPGLSASDVRAAIGLVTANLDTQLSDIFNKPGLSAADMRSALGLAAANLDVQLSDLAANVDSIDDLWPGGDGAVTVDQDYGGTSALTYTLNGTPVDGATVRVYLAADYNANRRGESYVVAGATQGADGTWSNPVLLDPGSYKLMFYLRNVAGPDVYDLTVVE